MPKRCYTKPFLTYDEQISLMEARGLIVDSRESALAFLSSTNYHRFKGYFHGFTDSGHPDHSFHEGITFEHLRSLYRFDSVLRQIVSEGVQRVEICAKTRLAYYLARVGNDPFAHIDKGSYRDRRWREASGTIEALWRSANRLLSDPRIEHFQKEYVEFPNLPIWAAVEVASFSDVSKLYECLTPYIQRQIAGSFGISEPSLLGNWLHHLSVTRNHCAHYSRLWDYHNPTVLKSPANWGAIPNSCRDRLVGTLLCISALIACWDERYAAFWRDQIRSRIGEYLSSCPLADRLAERMGLGPGWQDDPLWTTPLSG